MSVKHARQIERLERLLAAERERAEKAWEGYRAALYENVEIKMRLEAVERLPKLLQSLMANPVRDNRKNKGSAPSTSPSAPKPSGFGGMDDDIPF